MDIGELRSYCLLKPGVTENFSFEDRTVKFKVGGKVFLSAKLSSGGQFVLKCDPDRAGELDRDRGKTIPGFRMNKRNCMTVSMENIFGIEPFLEHIDHSYCVVFNSLSKKSQKLIKDPFVRRLANLMAEA